MGQRNFSIIAATLHGNRGAQAMVETVVGSLREHSPGCRFHLFSYYPAQDRHLLRSQGVQVHSSTPLALVGWLLPWSIFFGALRHVFGRRIYRLAPVSIRALADSEALVDLAGVAFIDGREKFLPFNILTILPAWLLGVPVVKMPQAMGPFDATANRLAARWALRICSMVWARGAGTRAHLEHARFPGVRFEQADDLAFNYSPRFSMTDEGSERLREIMREAQARRSPEAGLIGVCPSSVVAVQSRKSGGNYEAVLANLVRGLAERGHLVILFPNATRESAGDAERNNDIPLIRRVYSALPDSAQERVLKVDFDVNAAGIKTLLEAFDVALVSRFHAMVGALSLGVPPAVLGWSHKYVEVMDRFGLGENVMDYKELDGARLQENVARLLGARDELRARILAALPAVQASARRPLDQLAERGILSDG